MENQLKELLKEGILEKQDTALMFSGGVDSCIVLSILKDLNINPRLYCSVLESTVSDDLEAYHKYCSQNNIQENIIEIPLTLNTNSYFTKLIEQYKLPKRKRSSLLVLTLFIQSIQSIQEKNIYTGLGSDAYYGLGRDFRIQCSLKGEKIPSIDSLREFRNKTYSHYMEQYNILKIIAKEYNKNILAPFLSTNIYNYMFSKTFIECNKPKPKQILIDLYPEFFKSFKARLPSNFQCGNSNFKNLLKNLKEVSNG